MNNEGVTVTGAEECPVDKFWGNGLGEKWYSIGHQKQVRQDRQEHGNKELNPTDNTLQVSSVRVVR